MLRIRIRTDPHLKRPSGSAFVHVRTWGRLTLTRSNVFSTFKKNLPWQDAVRQVRLRIRIWLLFFECKNVFQRIFAKSNGYLISKVGLILNYRILTETAIYKGFEANDEFVKKISSWELELTNENSAPHRWLNDGLMIADRLPFLCRGRSCITRRISQPNLPVTPIQKLASGNNSSKFIIDGLLRTSPLCFLKF